MIDTKTLTPEHIGRYVRYEPTGEIGRIRNWKGSLIFVVYHCNDEWDRYQEFTAAQTHASSLEWMPAGYVPPGKEAGV